MTLGRILAEEIHKTPGKTPIGDDCKATARPLLGPRQNACRGHQQGHCQARITKTPPPFASSCQPNQLGRQLRGNMQLLGQLAKHLHGGMQIFVKTLPPHQLSSQPASVALLASSAWTRVGARRGSDGRDEPLCRPR